MIDTAPNDFRRVLAAGVVSNFGSMLSRLVVPWLAAITLNASPWQMSCLLLADVAAGALGALFLGARVDRWPKRTVVVACDLCRWALLVSVALASWSNSLNMVTLTAAAAAGGVLTMAFELARSAWMAQALQPEELTARNAQLSVGASLAETVAFALGGWLFQGLGAVLALLVDAMSYLLSAMCLRGLKDVGSAPAAASPKPPSPVGGLFGGWRGALQGALADVRGGIAVITASPLLRRLALLELLLALSSAQFATCYLVYLSRDIQVPVGVQGMVFAMGGLGALLGAWLVLRWAPPGASGIGGLRALACGLIVATLGAFCVPAANDAGWLAIGLLVAHQVVGDAGTTMAQTHDRTLRQTQVPLHQLAMVDGALRAVGQSATVLGALMAAALATAAGNRAALVLAAVLLAVAAMCAFKQVAPSVHAAQQRHNRSP